MKIGISTAIIFIIVVALLMFVNYKCNNKLADIEDIETDPKFENITYDTEEDISQDDVLGILTIEKIGLNVTVKDGSDSNTLLKYVGHIEETAMYDGNIGLAGHNRGNNCSFFARLNELKEGDILTYKTKFYTRDYKVTSKKVIYETDWSMLNTTQNNKLTLITCIKDKRNQRLCVQATEILQQDL